VIDPNDTPAKKTAEAEFMADERAMIATLMAGTGAMRAASTKYLPKAPAESDDAYEYRLAVSTLYNGMRRTVETMSGKPFSEPIKLGDDMPSQIVEWCDDVDLQGRDLHAFAHSVFADALANGISHVLVDYPPVDAAAVTQLERAAIGARPYFVHLKHDQITGWRSERINGVETLTQLRFLESVNVPTGVWTVAAVQQVRVLEPTKWSTYRQNERGEWVLYEEGVVTLGKIPLATTYCDRQGYMQARPPLLDLAWLNIEHWQSSSDQSNILHVARVPILFAAGFDDGALKIGAGSVVSNDEPAATLKYVEHSGAAIAAGRTSIKDLEERMSLAGAQLLMHKPGARTATEKAIDSADADCALSLMTRNHEDTIDLALQFMADWENLGKAGEVELTGEIGGPEETEFAGLMRARELGLLSAETVFSEMQRRGLLSDDITWEDEAARIKVEGPPLAIGTKFEAQGGSGAAASVPGAPAAQPGATPPASGAPAVAHPAAAPVHAAPPAPIDFSPLIDAMHELAASLQPQDLTPLIEAMNARESSMTMEMDCTPIAEAVAEAIKSIPAPVVNIPAQPAHTINVDATTTVNQPEQPAPVVNIQHAPIQVDGPTVNVTPAAVNVAAPVVNVQPPAVTVEAPTVNVAPPAITVESPTINVQPAPAQRTGSVTFEQDADGNITGATLE